MSDPAKPAEATTHKAFEVDAELEKEFQKALQHQLTDEDIAKAELLLGIDVASKQRELNSVATPDAIRNWALGVGDDNPLYTEEEYGEWNALGDPDRPRHPDGAHQDADARRSHPRRDQGSDEEHVPWGARVRLGRHVGVVPTPPPR